jgi:hypothetical protein
MRLRLPFHLSLFPLVIRSLVRQDAKVSPPRFLLPPPSDDGRTILTLPFPSDVVDPLSRRERKERAGGQEPASYKGGLDSGEPRARRSTPGSRAVCYLRLADWQQIQQQLAVGRSVGRLAPGMASGRSEGRGRDSTRRAARLSRSLAVEIAGEPTRQSRYK